MMRLLRSLARGSAAAGAACEPIGSLLVREEIEGSGTAVIANRPIAVDPGTVQDVQPNEQALGLGAADHTPADARGEVRSRNFGTG
jgi:hypothetical protein